MTEELKKRIQKRIDDVADENGMITFDDFIKLTKEFFGEFPQNVGEGFEDNEIPLDDI